MNLNLLRIEMWQHVNLRIKAILKSVYPFLPATKAIDRYSIFGLKSIISIFSLFWVCRPRITIVFAKAGLDNEVFDGSNMAALVRADVFQFSFCCYLVLCIFNLAFVAGRTSYESPAFANTYRYTQTGFDPFCSSFLNWTLLLNKFVGSCSKHLSHFIVIGFENCLLFKEAYLGRGAFF